MKGDRDMPMLRLIRADESFEDEPLRFPTEAVRAMDAARAASRNSTGFSESQFPQHDSSEDLINALRDVARCADEISRELDVLGRLGCGGDGGDGGDGDGGGGGRGGGDDRPRAA